MSNGTLSTQHELLSGLADNNAKLITAADVSNIVKSNYQPVMIWSGIFTRDNSTPGDNRWYSRTNYYNPDFFQPRSTGVGVENANQIWRFTNRGTLAINTTYTNIAVNPDPWYGTWQTFSNQYISKPATFNITTDGNGRVDSYEIVSCGQGWFGPAGNFSGSQWTYPGQTGVLNVAGFSGSSLPTVEFISPLTPVAQVSPTYWENPAWTISTNPNSPGDTVPGQGASLNHTFINTAVHRSNAQGKGEQRYNPGLWIGPEPGQTAITNPWNNRLQGEGWESGGSDVPQYVTLWRMPF